MRLVRIVQFSKFYFCALLLCFGSLTATSAAALNQEALLRQAQYTFADGNARTPAIAVIQRYAGELSAASQTGLQWILSEELFAETAEANYALLLLAHVLRNIDWSRGETMPIAFALAYNQNYAKGNNEVRQLLLADIIRHFQIYRTINAWQQKVMPYAALSKQPVIAQTFWAMRDRSGYYPKKLAVYQQRLLALDELERLHVLLAGKTEIAGADVYEWGNSVVTWYRSNMISAKTLTKELQGYAINPLLSYQRQHGKFPTQHCVADASNLLALLQAIGLAPLTYYQNFRSAGAQKGINHEWPAAFDAVQHKWVTLQRKSPWPKFEDADTPVDFEIFRPMWHHRLAELGEAAWKKLPAGQKNPPAHIGPAFRTNSYGERTTNGAMRNFVLKGMPEEVMLKIWLLPVWETSKGPLLTQE